MRISRFLTIAAGVALVHFAVYFILFGAAHAYGMANREVPVLIQVPFAILGAPLAYLLYLPPSTFGTTRWWGGDGNFMVAIFVCNSLLWGSGLAVGARSWAKRRTSTGATTA
jgi:hypothetical protein